MNTPLTKNGFLVSAFAVTLFGFLFFTASSAHAQFLGDRESPIFLSLSPEHPSPKEVVRITADSSFIDLSRSDIEWSVGDKIIAQGHGQKSVDVVAGSLGSRVRVSVTARASDGASASGEALIRPAKVDLLWESDSYAPPFYRGRALPSAGTFIRVSAIVHFEPEGIMQAPEQDIIYTWKRNGSIVPSASGKGRSSATFPSPTLFGTDTIRVAASTEDGRYEGEARAAISSIEPVLALYKDHPLFGIMYNQALEKSTFVPDAEMTFAAVPYFAEAEWGNDPRLIYSWSVNGVDIPTDESRRSALTVNADRSNGIAQIALFLTHTVNLFMQTSGSWEVSFGATTR